MINKFRIDPDTRMNSLDMKIRLSDWSLSIRNKTEKIPLVKLVFHFGGHDTIEFINSLIDFLDKELFANYRFYVVDKKKSLSVDIVSRKFLFDVTPPITITSLSRGNIANSVKSYGFDISFNIDFKSAIRLMSFLKDKTHKDLVYDIIKTRQCKRKVKSTLKGGEE